MSAISSLLALSGKESFHVVFMDPPYECDLEAPVLEALDKSGIIDNDTMIIIETSLRTDIEQWNDNHFTIERVKSYKTNQHVFLSYNMEG